MALRRHVLESPPGDAYFALAAERQVAVSHGDISCSNDDRMKRGDLIADGPRLVAATQTTDCRHPVHPFLQSQLPAQTEWTSRFARPTCPTNATKT
jgi:hypothetical protein